MEFDRLDDGERVFTVNVLNTQTTFQLNRYIFFRAIVQYDSSQHRVLTDLLASWELLPGTVAYAGLRLADRAAGVGRAGVDARRRASTTPASAACSSRPRTSIGSERQHVESATATCDHS